LVRDQIFFNRSALGLIVDVRLLRAGDRVAGGVQFGVERRNTRGRFGDPLARIRRPRLDFLKPD
jgi:hypothetical protein